MGEADAGPEQALQRGSEALLGSQALGLDELV
jgi:hypothetical protein